MRRTLGFGFLALAAASAFVACGGDEPAAPRPNVIWIVWDTVRADRLGVYGYERPTTPNLDAWAKGARVFEDCISPGSWTVPSHASMFTGLLPTEHGAEWGSERVDDKLVTIAELLRDSGYQTFCWTANPHVSSVENATQGFEVEQHPWDEASIERARAIFDAKRALFPADSSLRKRGERSKDIDWALKAAGELGQEGLLKWLGARDRKRPYFAFLNYMEAHRPLISPPQFREAVMTPEEVAASYNSDVSWGDTWGYCFGLVDVAPQDLHLLARSYDAGIRELDHLFGELTRALEAAGELDNTVIVLTSDHGDHLTEHHLLDHQYSVAQVLVRVPLIVKHPTLFPPGREARPVMSMDLFPTLVELGGVRAPRQGVQHGRSLLDPAEKRARITQYTKSYPNPLAAARVKHPEADLSRFERGQISIVDRPWKLVQPLGGASQLFNIVDDPYETRDVAAEQANVLERMTKQLGGVMKSLRPIGRAGESERSEEHQKLLDELGYAESGEDDEDDDAKKAPTDGKSKAPTSKDSR
jgi:arylsulfatase A-like enzyme